MVQSPPAEQFVPSRWMLGRRAFRWPVSFRYAAGISRDIAYYTLNAIALVEGIFLSDLLISEILPRVLEHQAGFGPLLYLVMLAFPEGLFLALPIALVVSVYLVLLRRREAGEFIVLAGTGYDARMIVAAALFTGLCGLGISAVISSYVEPLARYGLQRAYLDLTFQSVRSGQLSPGKFFSFGQFSVFAAHSDSVDEAAGLFVHQQIGDGGHRVILADRALGLDVAGAHKGVLLDHATIVDFNLHADTSLARCATCTTGPQVTPVSTNVLSQFSVPLPNIQVPDMRPRGLDPEEWMTPELLSQDMSDPTIVTIFGIRLFRGLLCLIAPMFAVLAVAFTNPRTFLFALPVAAALVLSGSFFGPTAVGWIAVYGPLATSAAIGGAAALVAALAIWLIRRFEARCIGVARVRI